MKFRVFYSQEKDVWNYLDSLWKFNHLTYGRENIRERLLKNYPESFRSDLNSAKSEKKAKEIIEKYLNWRKKSFADTNPIIIDWLQNNLNKNKTEIIKKLETVYEQKFPFKEITVYLTTAGVNPYSYKDRWFMTGKNQSIEGHLKTTLHELNHFMFYYYYPDLIHELGKERYEILKEALAIYTNPEGNDKPNVKKLEDYFKENLNKSIPEVLKNGEWRNFVN